KQKFYLKAFDFTIDEISKVMTGYIDYGYRYPKNVRVDSIYGNLRRIGWGQLEAREFIISLEERLEEKGIEIERTEVDLHNYIPKIEDTRNFMEKYKNNQELFHQNHDISSIEMIRDLRGDSKRKIEKCKCMFLTSDGKLSRLNFIEMGHRENSTICEIIFDKLLTTILWLKNPRLNISLRSIITAYSRDLFVKKRIWGKFYDIVSDLKREGKIWDDHISTLFYHGYIEDSLKRFDDNETGIITYEFVLDEIERANEFKEKEIAKRIEIKEKAKEKEYEEKILDKENEFIKILETEANKAAEKARREKNKEWLKNIEKIKENISIKSNKDANKIINTIRGVLLIVSLLVATTAAFILVLSGRFIEFSIIAGLFSTYSFIFSLNGFPKKDFWSNREAGISKRLNLSRLRNSGLERYLKVH
ncbi:MAG: hypothetical protein ACXADY_02710, partial [Candidatus Hodarchaeales archaeon]